MIDNTIQLFTLEPERWYAWQMIPGYASEHYYSPIYIHKIEKLRRGNGSLTLDFFNACYAEGVRNFSLEMRVLHRSTDYMITRLLYDDDSHLDRSAIISPITHAWLHQQLGWQHLEINQGESLDSYLSRHNWGCQ